MAEDDVDDFLKCAIRCKQGETDRIPRGEPLESHPLIAIEPGYVFRGPEGKMWRVVGEDLESDEVRLKAIGTADRTATSRANLSKQVVDGGWERVEIITTVGESDGIVSDDTRDRVEDMLLHFPEVTDTERRDAIGLINSRSREFQEDPHMEDVTAEFVVDHSLEDAGVPREERLAIVEELF